jgi:hypothetical protein
MAQADIRIADCGNGYHALINLSGPRAFYFLESLRKRNLTNRVQLIEGCILTNAPGVRADRLEAIKDMAADAGLFYHVG